MVERFVYTKQVIGSIPILLKKTPPQKFHNMFSKFLSPLEQFDSASFIEKTQLGEIKNLYSFYMLKEFKYLFLYF